MNAYSFLAIYTQDGSTKVLQGDENEKEWNDMSKKAEERKTCWQRIYLERVTNGIYVRPSDETMAELEEIVKEEDEGNYSLFVHYSITDEERKRNIVNSLKQLVQTQNVPTICKHLGVMARDNLILLPEAQKAYDECVRLGMPTGKKYSLGNFGNYYPKH